MQVVPGKNYFELFGLPVSFEVDISSLRERYRDLQRSAHPDRFANASDRERRLSMQQASLINEAHRALKDPLQRARYLLSLHGIDINDESNTVMDGMFLMEQMELREELDAIPGKDEPLATLAEFTASIESRISERVQKMTDLFANVNDENLQQAHSLSLQLQFLYRLREEAESREESLL
ncbi:co-chaperone HscB [Sulfuriflexus sp.]|uniref:co-chaperone HscB n=1 Tax=Sulfuriflexus sp. TaxID=2015443 RepID=UPI0028CE7A2F|nr:co-chaperone HscB [Sulfuriflexus sp.]MDT8404057.1 co-chaperone HscB [Sulfuriflexus sp.]